MNLWGMLTTYLINWIAIPTVKTHRRISSESRMKWMQSLRNSSDTRSLGWLQVMLKGRKKYKQTSRKRSNKSKRPLKGEDKWNSISPYSSSKRGKMEERFSTLNFKIYTLWIQQEEEEDLLFLLLRGVWESSMLVIRLGDSHLTEMSHYESQK